MKHIPSIKEKDDFVVRFDQIDFDPNFNTDMMQKTYANVFA